MIDIENVRKIYGQGGQSIAAVNGVSLHVDKGEIYGVLGISGAGKSTLIRCVNMLEKPTSGSITVNGRVMETLSPEELRQARQHIGMIFQHFNLLSSRTVADNIALPLEIIGMEKKARYTRVEELLSLVGLEDKARAYPGQLSGGQKQRVGIARALATQPDVLLSDEATSALDPKNTTAILELLQDLNKRLGLTILLITHEMAVVRQICDRVAVIEDGQIVEEGKVLELIGRPGSLLSNAIFPPVLGTKIHPEAVSASITFVGDIAEQPVLSSLVRQFDVDVNILGGSIQNIGGSRVGKLQVELSGNQIQNALAYLNKIGLKVEVH